MPRLLILILSTLLLCLLVPAPYALAQTNEPSREPILRIETGMHTATIKRIGVDAANRYLVTASDDKTVRVWELASGKLLRTIRVPIGAGGEGRLYAVAISPDGSTIAAGGFTSGAGEPTNLYLFERESGRLVRRLGGLPDIVSHLAFTLDGRFLAVTLITNGVRVYQTSDYSLAGTDTDYGDSSYGVDFDHSGRLVTTCLDGFIRLYAPPGGGGTLRLLAKEKVAGGGQPFSAAFSADGSRVAVGFTDSTQVAVLSGRDLSPLNMPDTAGVNNGALFNVAWSADGRTLYAGGFAQGAKSGSFIRAWADGGRGAYRDIVAAADTIMHILPLRDGGIVYSAADPAFGVIDSSGRRTLFTPVAIADYRILLLLQGLRLAPDDAGVEFAYDLQGNSSAHFSLAERELATTSVPPNWRAPTTSTIRFNVTDWLNSFEPKLNGTRLPLVHYEKSFSLAIAPDARAFLLGTSFNIRLFDGSGKERWNVPAPGVAWAVNITADGRLAVAAYGDGTIRWYRMTDGQELLAFFPHADRKRWVMWTPEGYYDASPGAEDLIGWHVNNGRDATADFFPVGQFRSTYYRPDVVAKILKTGDEQLALKQANEENGRRQQQASIAQQLPPVVEIISPTDGALVSANEVTVRFNVRSSSGEPLTNVKALVDGRPASARQLVQGEETANGAREIKVSLPARDSEVSVIAENRFAASTPATVHLKWRGTTLANAARSESIVIKPKLYILAIGVSQYSNEKYNLLFADKDARDFINTMQTQKGLLYRDVVIYHGKPLLNGEATKDEILDGLDWIRKETTSNDVAMVFFAGHGVNDQSNYYYFCPYNIDPEKLLRTGVAFSDIRNTVSAIAGKAIFFVDTCHSGNSLGLAGRRGSLDINIVINELSSAENGVVVFSASTGSESSYERAEWNNGAFTKSLVEGLNGAASIGDTGRITYAMLNVYISERVKELTKGQQHPTMISPRTVADFPIAVKK